jgi:DNA topoisomerase-6 subunit A
MLSYPWFNKKSWQREIRTMLRNGVKAEIEALSAKGISFISEQYLPKKLRDKDWLA